MLKSILVAWSQLPKADAPLWSLHQDLDFEGDPLNPKPEPQPETRAICRRSGLKIGGLQDTRQTLRVQVSWV